MPLYYNTAGGQKLSQTAIYGKKPSRSPYQQKFKKVNGNE
jgi:hypothetical protein